MKDDLDSLMEELVKHPPKVLARIFRKKRVKRKSAKRKHSWDISSTEKNLLDERKHYDGVHKNYMNTVDGALSKVESRDEFFLAGTSLNDHYLSKLLDYRTSELLESTYQKEENFVCSDAEWREYTRSFGKEWQVVEFGDLAGILTKKDVEGFIDYSISNTCITVKLYGTKEFVEREYGLLSQKFTIASCTVEWVYGGDGSSVEIPLTGEKLPITEMYPFLNGEEITEYYDRFLESSASILLLIGPPGTGKTTFIRGLLFHSGKNAMVTYDEKILDKDYIFARFIESDAGVMVIEDADNFLKSRKDGNHMMHRFLNVGDGLITMKGKKLIFSTNLPSIKDIDPALTRPGRCFDILHFDNYTKQQAKKLADKLNIAFEPGLDQETFSLAEVFFQQRNTYKPKENKMGFV
jgi:hypothetical protein